MVNDELKNASQNFLTGILGYEERFFEPINFKSDPDSSIEYALSEMVVDSNILTLYLWYNNEYGYANRPVDLVVFVERKCET